MIIVMGTELHNRRYILKKFFFKKYLLRFISLKLFFPNLPEKKRAISLNINQHSVLSLHNFIFVSNSSHMDNVTQETNRERIFALLKAGIPYRQIANQTKASYATVKRIANRIRDGVNMERKPGSGRKMSLTGDECSIIMTHIRESPKMSTSKLANVINENRDKPVNRETIRSYLDTQNLLSCAAAIKPYLTNEHIAHRLSACTGWLMKPFKYFKNIIFSEESRFCLFRSDGRERVWRLQGSRYKMKNCTSSVKHNGGSIMFLGCISYNGVGKLAIVENTMDSIAYTRILSTYLQESIDLFQLGDGVIFQQDNAPCHKSKFTMRFFEENQIKLMDWPAQSPDLNIIEHMWSYIDQKLSNVIIKSKSDLIQEVSRIWYETPTIFVKRLYEGLPRRFECVVRNKGGHIPY